MITPDLPPGLPLPAEVPASARVCENMSDRPTPLTDEASFSTVYQGELVKASFARDLERQRNEWMDRTTDALAQFGNLTEQRDAYAETLRALRVECYDFIDQRHPELAEENA